MNLTDLLSTLAKGWPSQFVATAPDSIRFVSAPNPRFVDPPLRVEKPMEHDTAIVLVSSPAALGKSTVAAEVAHRQNAPLWDLSRAMVGTGSFEGTLVRSFGAAAYARVEESLKGGTALFLIDSLDEGQLRVPATSFEEFMGEVCAFLASARPSHPSLVLLGRSDAALWMSLWLEDRGVPFSHVVLDFFLEDQAYEFVTKWLDSRGHTAHRGYQEAFGRACRSLFKGIASALAAPGSEPTWDQPPVRAFLGYAPVLECIAEYLRVGNYEKLDATLKGRTTEGRNQAAGTLLTRFAEELVRREQHEKVIPAMKGRLGQLAKKCGDWQRWEILYQPGEQQQRVFELSLGKSHQLPSHPSLSTMPTELRAAYDESVSEFVAMHPFAGGRETRGFAGVVFEEYVYAWAMRQQPLNVAPLLERRLAEEGYLPTPLLSWFVLGKSAEGAVQLSGQAFGAFHDSLLAAQEHAGAAPSNDLVILERDGSRSALIATADQDQDITINLSSQDGGEPIVVWRRLRDALVDVRCAVRLGIRGVPFSIGPNVEVHCGRLTVDASEFRVYTESLEGSVATPGEVVIEAGQYLGSHPEPRIRRYGGGRFAVWWPDLTYPWVGHQGTRRALPGADPRLAAALTHLRRILRRFRMHAGIGVSAGISLIKNVAVGETEDDALLLEYLLEQRILRTYERLYVLESARAEGVGLNWASIHRAEPDDAILGFLGRFLHWIDNTSR